MSMPSRHAFTLLAPGTLQKVIARGRLGRLILFAYVACLCIVLLLIFMSARQVNWPGVLLWFIAFYLGAIGTSGYGPFGTRLDLSIRRNRVLFRVWRGGLGVLALCCLAIGFVPLDWEWSAVGYVVVTKQYFLMELSPLFFFCYMASLLFLALTVVWVAVIESPDE